jgi:hypothetical protein
VSRANARYLANYLYGRTLKLLKSIAARVDLPNFPGSCCG